MTAKRTTDPTALAVLLADAKNDLRIDSDDTSMDTQVTAWIAGVTDYAEHLTRRSIMTQGWTVTLDAFPTAIELPAPPVRTVASVQFYDINNVLQTLDPSDYTIDDVSEPGFIVPVPGTAWPDTYDRINAVRVTLTCGYGADASAVPKAIGLYIRAKVVELEKTGKNQVMPSFIDSLLDRYKIWSL